MEGQVGEGVVCVAGWVTARVRPGEALLVGVVVTLLDHKSLLEIKVWKGVI